MSPFFDCHVYIQHIADKFKCFAGLTVAQANDTDGILTASISPNGKWIAAIGYAGITTGVILINVDNMSVKTIRQAKMVSFSKRNPDGDVQYFNRLKEPLRVTWLSDDMIAVDFNTSAETLDLSGKTIAEIGQKVFKKTDLISSGAPMVLAFTDDSYSVIGLVNARTGSKSTISTPLSGSPFSWIFDKNGVLRSVSTTDSPMWQDATIITHWYRAGINATWEKLANFSITDEYWMPIGVSEKPNTLVVKSSIDRDTLAVFNYDIETRQIAELLVGHPNEDVLNIVGDVEKTLEGVATNGMVPHKYWFKPEWRDLQIKVDAVLPKRINILDGDPAKRVLVRSSSDTDPGTWFVLDVKEMTLTSIGRVQSSIDPAQMLPMKMFSYPTNDGLNIPSYLTLPRMPKVPGPMVVMIHGGPATRDTWSWNPDVQLLAAHGYIVFQPQFRGSSGFGKKFFQSGIGQWGLKMQDDITEGVEYLIKAGIADRNRICIYGASYGGYASLWGMEKTPDLYKCGVSVSGVVDISLMLEDWSDINDSKILRELQRAVLGDPVADIERLSRVSPLKHADLIKAPVLIMHGEDDQRVPIDHSDKMRIRLDGLHKQYEAEYFADEGHGISYLSNANKFYQHLFKFLDKYIGTDLNEDLTGAPDEKVFVPRPGLQKRLAERRRIFIQPTKY